MKQANFVGFEQNMILYFFLTLKQCFDAMALLAWWSAAEAKLITNHEKINELSDFVQMLQTGPVSSSFEVIIMFPGQNFIKISINGDNVR